MVTKKDLDNVISELTEKFNIIAEELESLYRMAIADGHPDYARAVEQVQFNGYTNPSQFASKHRFDELYKIIEENESAKNLDKFIEYEHFVKSVRGSLDWLDSHTKLLEVVE